MRIFFMSNQICHFLLFWSPQPHVRPCGKIILMGYILVPLLVNSAENLHAFTQLICQIWTTSFCSKVMGELDLAKGMHCVLTTILVCHSPSACMHSQVKECKQCSSAPATVATLLKAGASIIHPHMHPNTPMHVWRNTSTPIQTHRLTPRARVTTKLLTASLFTYFMSLLCKSVS